MQCLKCIDKYNIEENCTKCGKREVIIKNLEGDDLLQKMFSILGHIAEKFNQVYVFAHNGGGYDFQFVADYMIRVEGWIPNIILNGSKIIQMSKDRVTFKDTLNFFHKKLAALPKMFGIQNKTKGYFPHMFNKSENQGYEGPLPDSKYYDPDSMSDTDRKEFFKWYNKELEKNENFNFQREMLKYCRSDVEILRIASLTFRKLFLSQLGVDPLTSSATIAAACMNGYRTKYLPENTIPLMTFKTYRMRDNQSDLAIRYLKYFEDKYNVKLQSAYRGVEKRIGRYSVDGYCPKFPVDKLGIDDPPEVRPLILEIQGCFFHGCPTCFTNRTTPIYAGSKKSDGAITMESRYQNTLAKMEYLKNLESHPIIIEKWECQIIQEGTEDDLLRRHLTDPNLITPILTNREAFYGGRTESFCRHHKVDESKGEKIRYIDINSLYPYVNKYGTYPIGHPEILIGDTIPQSLNSITGVAKVCVEAPKDLFLPVLPIRTNNKLVFALCRACAERQTQDTCHHTGEQRQFIGTYTCLELRKAVQKGYQLKQIYEVWSYKSTQYDKNTKKGGLFSEYIDLFSTIKQKSSGYPPNVRTDEDKKKFVKELYDREGITLKVDEIQSNPGLRSLSKLCLNSLWGKFGQRNNVGSTTIIDSQATLFQYLEDPSKEISSIMFMPGRDGNDIAYVNWKVIEECAEDSNFINPIICAHVTAEARLVLYEYLEKLGNCVLYCDTDSIIYTELPHDLKIETGPFLGQMGDELATEYGEGAYITEFICGGPKNYGYCVKTAKNEYKYVVKIRGITLNHQVSKSLNFENMKEFILNPPPNPVQVKYENKIQRKRPFMVINHEATKKYGEVSSKRRKVGLRTLPYGYIDPDIDMDDQD
ncbi:uncharacterized protein LOC135844487 [Planococcus citri]|uniref:uncharacterized protein LOC135844487 n=1 Tax=Planococcus citri TaxID=170843 RepID=UPI0031F78B0D